MGDRFRSQGGVEFGSSPPRSNRAWNEPPPPPHPTPASYRMIICLHQIPRLRMHLKLLLLRACQCFSHVRTLWECLWCFTFQAWFFSVTDWETGGIPHIFLRSSSLLQPLGLRRVAWNEVPCWWLTVLESPVSLTVNLALSARCMWTNSSRKNQLQ